MSLFTLIALLVSQFCMVGGQILIKHAMNASREEVKPWKKILGNFGAGIGALTVSFFLWLGFLQRFDLSHVFPFEGLSPVILVLGAARCLGEKIGWQGWVGIGLVSFGVILAGMS